MNPIDARTTGASNFARRVRWSVNIVAEMALVVVTTTLLIDRSAIRAFAQVVKKMKAINSVRLTMVTQFGKQPEIVSQMRLSGHLMRVDVKGGRLIQLVDFEQKKNCCSTLIESWLSRSLSTRRPRKDSSTITSINSGERRQMTPWHWAKSCSTVAARSFID